MAGELKLKLAIEYDGQAGLAAFRSDTESVLVAAKGGSEDLDALAKSIDAVGASASGAEVDSLATSLTEVAAGATEAGQALSGLDGDGLADATKAAEALSAAQAKAAVAQESLTQANQKAGAAQAELVSAVSKYGASSSEAATAAKVLADAERDVEKAMKAVADSTESAAEKSSVLSRAFGSVKDHAAGFAAIGAAGAAVGAGLAVAVSKAAEYDTVISQIATLGPEAAAGTAQWREEILSVSAAMGQDAVGAANAVYDALSSGVPADNVISFMETASKAAVAGSTDTSTAVSALSATLNAWKLDASEASAVSDTFFTGVNVGVFRFEELASSIGQVAPLAASLGVTYQEVTAATATLTKSGLTASQAITQQRASMISLLTPNAQMVGVLDQLAASNAEVQRTADEQGLSIGEAALKTLGYQGTLVALRDAADDAGVGLAQAMGSSEALGAVLGLTGENAAGAAADLELMNGSSGATDAAFETMSQTFEFASKQLKEQLNVALIEVGTTVGQMLVPVLQRGAEIATGLIERWNEMDEGTKRFLVTAIAVGAVLAAGLGAFVTLSALAGTIGPLFAAAAGGVTVFSGALMATGIGAVAVALGLLVKGAYDAGQAFEASYKGVSEAEGGLGAYVIATNQAIDKATGLAHVWNVLSGEALRNDLAVKKAGEAYLQHALGVEESVISSRSFQQESVKLAMQHDQGKLSLDEYNAALVELANAESMAAGEGRVLSEAQREQADALTASTKMALEKQGVVGEAVAADGEWLRVTGEYAAAVAQGAMTQEQYKLAVDAYTSARMQAVQAEQEAAAAMAVATGAVHSYSESFAALTGAGSQFIADEQERAAAIESAWADLSKGVQSNLRDQYDSYQQYQDDLAAARAADAKAAADAQSKRAEAEADHNEKMVELNARMEDAKTDKQRESAAKAIEKENEKWQGILSATESVGGANVDRVEEQYRQQAEAQRTALGQMIVDHVNSMVLMGQTSEDTAKTIFATLRKSYPDVEVFSPVADAHAHLMGTLRDATDDSSASQVESIAAIPEAINGAVGMMNESAAEHATIVEGWATADEVLAGRSEEAAARVSSASQAAADGVDDSGNRARQSYDQTGETALTYAGTTEEAGLRVAGAASTEADEVEGYHSRARDAYDQTGIAAGAYAGTVTQESMRAAQGVQTGAAGIRTGLQTAQSEFSSVGMKASSAAGQITSAWGGMGSGIDASAKRGKASLSELDQQMLATADTARVLGDDSGDGFGAGADAAEDAARGVTDSTDEMTEGVTLTTESVVLLREEMEQLPPEIRINFLALGLKEMVVEIVKLRGQIEGLLNAAMGAAQAARTATATTGGGKPRQRPDEPPGTGPDDSFADDPWGVGGDEGLRIPVGVDDQTGGLLSTDSGGELLYQRYLRALAAADYQVVVTSDLDETAILAAIAAATDEAQRLLGVLTAQQDMLVSGDAGQVGSLAWLFANWAAGGFPEPDFAEMMRMLNVPVETIEEFRAHWAGLDPEERSALWKRLYDDLRDMEKARHDEAKANIDDETNAFYKVTLAKTDPALSQITGAGGPLLDQIAQLKALLKSYEGQDDKGNETERAEAALALLEAELERRKAIADEKKRLEDDRHDQVMAALEAENEMVGRQFDDWKAAMKEIADLEKQREAEQKAFMKRLADERKEAESVEKLAHDLALDRLADLKDAEEERYRARLDAIDAQKDAEDRRHKDRMDALDDEIDRERERLDGLEGQMARLKIEMAELKLDTSSLEQAKSLLDDLKDALADLPKEGGRRRNPTGQVALDERARAALDAALASGKLDETQARRAQFLLKGGRLGLDQQRALLEEVAKLTQDTVKTEQSAVDAKQREIDLLQVQIDKEKLRFEGEQERIRAQQEAEKDRHDDRLEQIALEAEREKQAWDAFTKRVDAAKKAEDERHQAKMRQIEAEFRARLIAEGLAAEAGADPEEALRKAKEIADKIFAEINSLVGRPTEPDQVGIPADPSGGRQIKPIGGRQIKPTPRSNPAAVLAGVDPGAAPGQLADVLDESLMRIVDESRSTGLALADGLGGPMLDTMDEIRARAVDLSGIFGATPGLGEFMTGGAVAIDNGIHFHGDVTIDRDLAEEIGLVDAARMGAP